MKEQILIIKDNTIECVYSDNLPLSELGDLKVNRASSVEFNNETKMWNVIIKNKVLYSNKNRNESIEWEIEYLQNYLKEGKTISELYGKKKEDKKCHIGQK